MKFLLVISERIIKGTHKHANRNTGKGRNETLLDSRTDRRWHTGTVGPGIQT